MQYGNDALQSQTVGIGRSMGQPMLPRLQQRKRVLGEQLAKVDRAIELLEENPKLAEFVDAIHAVTNF